jgi:hypothetical protein
MRNPILLTGLVTGLLAAGVLLALPDDDEPADDGPPVEFGRVAWRRDLDAGLAAAAKVERPVLLLFQEVPG